MLKRFNHYYLTEQIGSKPLRSAYLAHHVNDVSQQVLLKIFDPICLAQGSENLLSQVEWIKQLRHAHIVPVLDLGVEQGRPYVVSEYLSGGSLHRRLDSLSLGRLNLQEALTVVLQVGQALSYFHENAHLHQNVKAENIFFNNQGEALLADFCLSGFIDIAPLDYQSDPHHMCYMAPEQFVGSASEKSDQYALACLAYELIAGRVPFSAQSFAMMWASHYAEVPVPLSDLVPGLPERIGEAIFKAMAKDPSERYADIAAFLLALEGSGGSTVLAITRPVALFTLDPFAMGVTGSLGDMKGDLSVTTSLADMPSEGSLTTAPFGTSLSGAAFGTSLPGVSFDMSLPGVPFGMSLPGVPFGMSLPGIPLGTSLPGVSLGTNQSDMALGTSLPGVSLGTNQSDMALGTSLPGVSLGTSLPENSLEKSLQEDFLEKALGENPFEADQLNTPLTTYLLERWEHASNESHAETNSDMSTGPNRNHSFSIGHFWRNTKSSIPALWLGQIRLLAITSWLIQLRGYLGSHLSMVKTSSRRGLVLLSMLPVHLFKLRKHASTDYHTKKVVDANGLAGDAPVKPLSVGCVVQRRRNPISAVLLRKCRELPNPALWFVIAISIIVLITGMTSYMFWSSPSSHQLKSLNIKGHQTTINIKNVPIDNQLIITHAPGMPKP